jgi:sec-independent protein translocase protein TatA
MFSSIGLPEIILILAIILIIFGVGKLPQVGGAIGKSIREFRKARSGENELEKEKPDTKSASINASEKI